MKENTTDSGEDQKGAININLRDIAEEAALKAVPQLSFLRHWKWILIGLLAVGFGVQTYRVATRDTTIAEHKTEQLISDTRIANLEDELKRCKKAQEDQNKNVGDYIAEKNEIQQEFDEFKRNFDIRVKNTVNERLKRLQAEATPKTCEEAKKYLQDHLGGRG